MDEPFLITVEHKGASRDFEATLRVTGYTHRFNVDVEGTEVIFERDEEGQYRAIVTSEKEIKKMDTVLLQKIAKAIEDILA